MWPYVIRFVLILVAVLAVRPERRPYTDGAATSTRPELRPQGTADLAVRPAVQTVYSGQEFWVTLRVEGSGEVVGADAWLHFDPAFLEALALVDGGTLDVRLGASIDNGQGLVKYGAGTFGAPKIPPFTLVSIRFRAKGPLGSTLLSLDPAHTDVQSPNGSILGALRNGQVQVVPPPSPTPTPTATPTPTVTPTPTATPTPTPTPTPLPVRVCAFVYHDRNRNGRQDTGEPLLADARLRLRDTSHTLLAEAVSREEGPVCFPEYPAGAYLLEEENPPGFSSTTPDMWGIFLTAGMSLTVSFGDVLTHGYVEGTLFEDRDGDGVRTPEERPIPHARVVLESPAFRTGARPALRLETESDAEGHFVFPEVPWGTYRLWVTDTPPGYLPPPVQTVEVAPEAHVVRVTVPVPPPRGQWYVPLTLAGG